MYVTTGGTRAWVVEPSPLLTARDLLAYEDRCRVAQADLRCDQRPAKLYLEDMRNLCACKNHERRVEISQRSLYDWVHFHEAADCIPLVVYHEDAEARFRWPRQRPDSMANILVGRQCFSRNSVFKPRYVSHLLEWLER